MDKVHQLLCPEQTHPPSSVLEVPYDRHAIEKAETKDEFIPFF